MYPPYLSDQFSTREQSTCNFSPLSQQLWSLLKCWDKHLYWITPHFEKLNFISYITSVLSSFFFKISGNYFFCTNWFAVFITVIFWGFILINLDALAWNKRLHFKSHCVEILSLCLCLRHHKMLGSLIIKMQRFLSLNNVYRFSLVHRQDLMQVATHGWTNRGRSRTVVVLWKLHISLLCTVLGEKDAPGWCCIHKYQS